MSNIDISQLITAEIKERALVPSRVTARQFKLQLLVDGLIDDVEAWVSAQGRATQIVYANAGEFDKNDPVMKAGFAEMGFDQDRQDQFFTDASKL